MRRLGFIVALGVSVALHLVLLRWIWTIPTRADRAPSRTPIEVELALPATAAESEAAEGEPESDPEPPRKSRREADATRRDPPAGTESPPTVAEIEPSTRARSDDTPGSSIMRRIDLFDPQAIAEGARTRAGANGADAPAPHSENPVQDMLDAATFGRRHGPRQSPAIKELAIRLDSWFEPPVETVRASGRAERRTIAERLVRYLAEPPRESLTMDDEYLDPFQVDDFRPDRAGLLCLTGCGGSHIHAKLLVLIEIDHTRDPISASVLVSSGYDDYDRAALEAVEDYAVSESAQLPIDAAATHWTFESEVYRYRRDELLLDPQFEPPGRRIDESFGYVYSLDTRIRMVAIAERETVSPDANE